jgi:hypothetical protein
MATDLLFRDDAYLQTASARVTVVHAQGVELERTIFYPPVAGNLPLIDEVFLELEDDDGRLRLLEDAEDGADYALFVTQAGGLLRYRLGDRVRVCGRHRGTALLEFAGRADAVSDLVGEKLGEAFVARLVAGSVRADAFCTGLPLLPECGRPRYCLLTDDPNPELARLLEEQLGQAFRYREARLLAQLDALDVVARPWPDRPGRGLCRVPPRATADDSETSPGTLPRRRA